MTAHLVSWSQARGRDSERVDYMPAMRCARAGRADWLHVVAHLTFAGRATCGNAAPYWVRRQLERWLVEITDDEMDALADGLVDEMLDVVARGRKWEVAP
jgi:hypothetical protein